MRDTNTLADFTRSLLKSTETYEVNVGDLEVGGDLESLRVRDKEVILDELGLSVLSEFLGIPTKYIVKCPTHFAKETLDFWISEYSESRIVVLTFESHLEAIQNDWQVGVDFLKILLTISKNSSGLQVVEFWHSPKTYIVDLVGLSRVRIGGVLFNYGTRLTLSRVRERFFIEELLYSEFGSIVAPVEGGEVKTKRITGEDLTHTVTQKVLTNRGYILTKISKVGEEFTEEDYERIKAPLKSRYKDFEGRKEDLILKIAEDSRKTAQKRIRLEELAGQVLWGGEPQ